MSKLAETLEETLQNNIGLADKVSDLIIENQRLRKALERIRDVCWLDDTEGVYLCDIGKSADEALKEA